MNRNITFQGRDVGDAADIDFDIPTEVDPDTGLVTASLSGAFASRALALSSPRVSRSVPVDDVTFITKFDSGHGWYALGDDGGITNLNATDRPFLGAQTLKYGPGDDTGNVEFELNTLNLNLTDKTLLLWLYTEDTNSNFMTLFIGSASYATNRSYTILNSELTPGEWTCIKIDVDAHDASVGTLNLAAVTQAKLRIASPLGTHTLHWAAFGHMPRQTTYPNGAVTITFDDSAEGIWTYARPKLEQYGYPAVCYVIGEHSEDAIASELNVENLLLAENALGWEVGGHADRLTDHVDLTTLTEAQAEDAIGRMKEWLLTRGFSGRHFAYPFGARNTTVEAIVKRYFSTARGVYGTTLPPLSASPAPTSRLFNMPTFSFASASDPARMKAGIDRAKAKKLWMPLTFHVIQSGASSGATASKAHFDEVIDYINAQGVAVVTLSEMFGLA